jgi:ribosomal protein L21E
VKLYDGESQRVFKVGDAVRFTAPYLSARPDDEKRFSGRVGKVTGYRMGAEHPIVDFPKDGRRKEQKLFEVNSSDLELVT